MAESTEDLREQVARLLAESDLNAKLSPAWEKLGPTGQGYYFALADTLLPLFAARERAAAEKALKPEEWREVMAVLRENYEEGMQSDAGPSHGDLAFYSGVEKLAILTNPYLAASDSTVRAQLEGEEA